MELSSCSRIKTVILCKYSFGLALATTPTSFIIVDPDIPQAVDFRNWVSDHMTIIKKTEQTPARDVFQGLLAYTPKENVVKISEIIPDSKNPWVKVIMTIDRTRQQLTYTACPKCMYMITARPGESYYCFMCKCNQTATLKCKLNATISDDSDSVKVTVFDKVAEQLLHKTIHELDSMTPQETSKLLTSTNIRLQDQTFLAQVKAQRKRFDDGITRFTMQQVHFNTTEEGNKSASVKPAPDDNREPNNAEEKALSATEKEADKNKQTTIKCADRHQAHTMPATSDTPSSPMKKMRPDDS